MRWRGVKFYCKDIYIEDNNLDIKSKELTTPCMNCGREYHPRFNVEVTRLNDGRIIWWHNFLRSKDRTAVLCTSKRFKQLTQEKGKL